MKKRISPSVRASRMSPRVPLAALLALLVLPSTEGQLNRAPQFVPGGDMARFALREDTLVDAPVYQLRGSDPEGTAVHYSISGTHFTVDRESGVVTLAKPLDREKQDLIEVIISITDESVGGLEPNTVSLRREVAVLDVNDNAPAFHGRPYALSLPETTRVGTVVFANISLTDADLGRNADIELECLREAGDTDDADACDTFHVSADKVGEGHFEGQLRLARPLDFERRSAYSVRMRATDRADDPAKRMSATARVAVAVIDVQDQPPAFLGAPYSAAVPENSPPGTTVLRIRARDGDIGAPRPILLELQGDQLKHFRLEPVGGLQSGEADLVTSDIPLDREHPDMLQSGGIYTFLVKATELINGELPGDTATSQITVIVTDVDDQLPKFNEPSFRLMVSEDVGADTPLPGLAMVVVDSDTGENARYTLSLRGIQNAPPGVFTVHPVTAQGRTPVVVRVADPKELDYDVDDESKRTLVFDVVASVNRNGSEEEVASSQVTVNLVDANDNAPVFPQSSYRLRVPEDVLPGMKIANITAVDKDSGEFGKIMYAIRGFGSEAFTTDPVGGGVFLSNTSQGLDFEKQKSYSLTLEAVDGGGRVSAVNLFVDVEDVNDNAPVFEQQEYSRTVREGATSFEPQFFIHATDVDGPTQGGGKIFYSLVSPNAEGVLFVEPVSGEVKLNTPARAADTQLGQYEFTVRATDAGDPPKHSDVHVAVRVGVPGNQRPVFIGHHNIGENAPASYAAVVKENATPGTLVSKVTATDPDGQDSLLKYFIAAGARDNFVIDNKTGEITVSPEAHLDLDSGIDHFDVVVHAVDSGSPVRETATATVAINVTDVNNKPPAFLDSDSSYIQYISERAPVGSTVTRISAHDPDSNAVLQYSILKPVRAIDHTGVSLQPGQTADFDFQSAFAINSTTGEITVARPLDHQAAAIIILTVQAQDKNAEEMIEQQVATAEVTIYVQAHSDSNPVFTMSGWSHINPVIRIRVPEEQPIGTTLLMLSAVDPTSGRPVTRFEEIKQDVAQQTFSIGLQSGNVVLNKRLDYETLDNKNLTFKVRAVADVGRFSDATVVVEVLDINDHTPKFSQQEYSAKVLESARHPEQVLVIKATDDDSINGTEGFGVVSYSLSGESASLFTVDPTIGIVRIAQGAELDREFQASLRFTVVAADTPQGGSNQRRASAPVVIEVLDVNDNAPKFGKRLYSAVVPENVGLGANVITVTATDPDEGPGGEIAYEILDEGEAAGLFEINQTTGEIRTKRQLTGKGRTDPYQLIVRAQDEGSPALSSDVPLSIFIGDVFTNDGVPIFVRPTLDEVAYVSENSTIGSPVFHVQATDPDDPNSPNGMIFYKFLHSGAEYQAFKIDRLTGLITTRTLLDRESQDSYELQLVVQDNGDPPQQATRLLRVKVTDIDDHPPLFQRMLDDEPQILYVEEEVPSGTEVGYVEAFDGDINENAEIDYLITYGNEDGLFNISRTIDNRGLITVAKRLDREESAEHVLTVKCFKRSLRPQSLRKQYNRQDPSEMQVKVKVDDIDDNKPVFYQDNITIGVRLNVPIDTSLLTLEATDADATADPFSYMLVNTTFFSFAPSRLDVVSTQTDGNATFRLDEKTGELRTFGSMLDFVDGYFELHVIANNSLREDWLAEARVKIFVVRDRDLLRFVFTRPPTVIRRLLPEFQRAVEKALLLPVSLNVYDTQFYSKDDGSLDFGSTSSCFQLVGKESYDLKDMESLLRDSGNSDLDKVYSDFGVQAVQRCAPPIAKAEASWIQLWVLAIAGFVGAAALIAVIVTCCLYSGYKQKLRRCLPPPRTLSVPAGSFVTSGASGGAPTVVLGPPPPQAEWGAHDNLSYHSIPAR
ncbi:cadherin-23 [Schistocerca piceifrons]|uniref:cadherin-23 n=1 Tax=Schistocerca piceifrons TaxID=274613 RepID=UPI001F5E9041|nr:cadherin-23 [Schistocerca piceifrons]